MRLPRPLLLLAAAAITLAHPTAALAAPTITTLAPAKVTIGERVVVTGVVEPALPGERVQVDQRLAGGWKRVGAVAVTDEAGAWQTAFIPRVGNQVRATQLTGSGGSSVPVAVAVAPKVLTARVGSGTAYPFLGKRVVWRVAPAAYPDGLVRVKLSIGGRPAGSVMARVRDGVVSTKLPTRGVGRFRAQLILPTRGGFVRATGGNVTFLVRGARVGAGSNVTWNRSLRAALRFRGFHVPGGTRFDSRMGEAVIAFHKAYGRPRTTTFEVRDWARLGRSRVAVRDRSKGLHIEIDKGRQILMQVRNGRATMIIHVSTGRTGNTPVGRHKIQWKGNWVPSLYDSMLYKSMAFRGAYAIHGYPSVPVTPASAGCVRVPMWIAAALYARSPVGTPVLVYEGPGSTATSIGRTRRSADVPELTGVDVARWADEGPVA